jgi:hypothetical protein
MQQVPIEAVRVIVRKKAIEAMQGEAPTTTIASGVSVKTARVVATNDAGMSAGADGIVSADRSDMSSAKPADMTQTTADMGTAAADPIQPGDVCAAGESTDMSAADVSGAAHTARVTASKSPATAARICLRGEQGRRQNGSRQNGYHLSHHVLHSVMCAPQESGPAPTLPMS